MRSFWLTAKIAVVFAVVMAAALVATLWLFIRVAGHMPLYELGLRRAREGVEVARGVEALLARHTHDDPAVAALLAEEGRTRRLDFSLEDPATPRRWRGWRGQPWHELELEVDGRPCRLLGPPIEIEVPVYQEGRRVALLRVEGSMHSADAHAVFIKGLLHIGGLTLAGVIGLALYLTIPLHRMSRSMDRIALGELTHRVEARGRDEVAAMGRSFNSMADRIGAMIRGQKELMAAVSHELRSPLARMKLSLELMRGGGASPARVDERIAEIETEIDTIDALVGELLLASRFELGAVPLARETLELEGLAREAWGRVAEAAARVGSTLGLELAEDARKAVADRTLVLRILGNLFENAVRHAGGSEVRLGAVRRGERVEITVADAGQGVAAEHLERLFEPFFRADPSRSRVLGSSGLGLMIVRRAVEAQGGTVRAERSPSGGLAVRFDLAAADGGVENPC